MNRSVPLLIVAFVVLGVVALVVLLELDGEGIQFGARDPQYDDIDGNTGEVYNSATQKLAEDTELIVSEQVTGLSSLEDKEKRKESVSANNQRGWKVITWNGKPAAGANVCAIQVNRELVKEWIEEIEADNDPEPIMVETLCDVDGSFDFARLEPGVYVINARMPGYSSTCRELDLSSSWPEDFVIQLGQPKCISGAVVDGSGKPVKGVEVWANIDYTGNLLQLPLEVACEVLIFAKCCESNKDGLFQFVDMSSVVSYMLEVDHENYMSVCKLALFYDCRNQEIILKESCVLEGRVVDKGESPIEGAEVYFRYPDKIPAGGEVIVTDEEGKYRFEAAPEGLIHLMAKHHDYGNSCCKFEVQAKSMNHRDIVLPEGISVTVLVSDISGNPISDMKVAVKDVETGTFLGAKMTDEQGVAKIFGLNSGDVFYLGVYQNTSTYPMKFGCYSFEKDGTLDIKLKKKSTVVLKVYDEETGDPIEKYKVCLCPYHTYSSVQEGMSLSTFVNVFEYDGGGEGLSFYIAPGEVSDATVYAEGYLSGRIAVIDDGSLDGVPSVKKLYLKKSTSLSCTVVSAVTGGAIAGAEVSCYLHGRLDKRPAYAESGLRSAKTNHEGVCALNDIAGGYCKIKVRSPGYAPTVVDCNEFDSFSPASMNVVRLWPSCVLTGTVTGTEQRPLEAVRLKVRIPGTNDFKNTSTNLFGKYVIHDLPCGDLDVFAEDVMASHANRTYVEMRKSIGLSRGGSGVLDFSFAGSCQISGWCTIEGRQADWGVIIYVYNDQGELVLKTSPSDSGYYKIDAVPSGVVRLEARSAIAGTGGIFSKTVELSDGEKKRIDIDISGRSLHGEVKGPDGKPVDAAVVELRALTNGTHQCFVTDHKGCFNVLAVEEGDYMISARAEGCEENIVGPFQLGGALPDRELVFALRLGGMARVLVRNREADPVCGASVFLNSEYSNGVKREAATGDSGICIFENLGVETMNIIAGAKGFAPSGAIFSAVPGEKTDCTVTLDVGGSLRIDVVALDGAPLSGVFITIDGFELFGLSPFRLAALGFLTPSRIDFRTDKAGRFTLGLLPPGAVTIYVASGSLSAEIRAKVTEGKETLVCVKLQ